MTFGITFQLVYDMQALGTHQFHSVRFGIEAGSCQLVTDHLLRQHSVATLPRSHRVGYNSINFSGFTCT